VPLSRNLGTLNSWNPLGHSRPLTGLLYLNFLEPSGPLQACNGTALPLHFIQSGVVYHSYTLYFNLSCVYGCLLSCASCFSCLGFIVVVLLYYGCIVTIIALYVLIAVYVRIAVVL
jgi:hypothetical protein